MKQVVVLMLSAALLLGACKAGEGIEVRDAWARPAAQGGNGGVFFELQNFDPMPDELIGASLDVAEVVEIHESKMDGDVMKMQMMPSLPIEAKATVTFKPGGLHVMLINLKQDLKQDDEFEVVLHFKNHPDITIQVKVGEGAPEEHQGM
jgi:copper(I)-binding protein